MSLSSLWVPIVLSAVLVFLASNVVHMVLPYHRNDYRALPSEDDIQDALRRFNIPEGDYLLPRPNASSMRDPAFLEKMKRFLASLPQREIRDFAAVVAQESHG